MFAGLNVESQDRSSGRSQYIETETNKYAAMYRAEITRNLLMDPAWVGNECMLSLKLSETGFVVNVGDAKGMAGLCRAAKAAILKINTFPMPKDAAVIAKLRNINLKVTP